MHIFLSVFVFRDVKESTQLLYCNMAERKFNRREKDKYSLSEKDELGKLCVKYKEEYDKKINENKSTVNFNERRKKHTTKLPKEGYIARAVRVLQRPRPKTNAFDVFSNQRLAFSHHPFSFYTLC